MERNLFLKTNYCLSCLEPIISGLSLKEKENVFICRNCSAIFLKVIPKEYIEELIEYCEEDVWGTRNNLMKIQEINYTWKIKSNLIDQSYLQWLHTKPKGNFLIYWPWKEFKPTIQLIYQEFLQSGNSNIIIIEDSLKVQKASYLINKTFFLPKNEIISKNNILRKKAKKVQKRLFETVNAVSFNVSLKGKRMGINQLRFGSTYKKLENDFEKEIKSMYGKDYEKYLTFSKKREKYRGWKCKYNILWTLEYLCHDSGKSFKFNKINEITPDNFTNELNQSEGHNISFMNNLKNLKDILYHLKKNRYNLVIFENFDRFIGQIYEVFNEFNEFLENSTKNETTQILCSINPSVRYKYRILNKKLLKNITIHAWDNKPILESIKSNWEENQYQNPISNILSERAKSLKLAKYEVEEIPKVSLIGEKIALIENKLSEELIKKIKYFFGELAKSPLYLFGDFSRRDVFVRRKNNMDLHADMILDEIFFQNRELAKEIESILKETYGDKEERKNPLISKLIELIRRFENSEEEIILIVKGEDIAGTKEILTEVYGSQKYYIVTSWRKFLSTLNRDNRYKKRIIISTQFPSLQLDLIESTISKLIFIGDGKTLSKIREIMDARLDTYNTNPLVFPEEGKSYPELLKEMYSSLNIEKEVYIDYVENSSIDLKDIAPFRLSTSEISSSSQTEHVLRGERAIILNDENDTGVFIPINRYLLLKDDPGMKEIKVTENNFRKLIDEEIILDKSGVYLSFKDSFLEYILTFQGEIKINRGIFQWNSFKDLVKDSYSWADNLLRAIFVLKKKESIGHETAEEKLSEILSKAKLFASKPKYIRTWWKIENQFNINGEIINIFPVECPKGVMDISKIYAELNKINPNFKLTEEDAMRAYYAAHTLQKIRQDFLKGKIKNIPENLLGLYLKLRDEIDSYIEEAKIFKPISSKVVQITEDVQAYKIYTNYRRFCT